MATETVGNEGGMQQGYPLDAADLLKVHPFAQKQYEKYPLTSLTAYTVYWLKSWSISPSFENVAVLNHRLFPSKFALVGWPQFPDITRTSRSILQMRPKYRNLATSPTDKGVFLTEKGVAEAETLIQAFGPPIFGEAKREVPMNMPVRAERAKRPRTIHNEDLISRVRNSQLFHMYRRNEFDSAAAIDLIALLQVYDHTPSGDKRRKLKELRDAAKDMRDEEVLNFLDAANERFTRYLNR